MSFPVSVIHRQAKHPALLLGRLAGIGSQVPLQWNQVNQGSHQELAYLSGQLSHSYLTVMSIPEGHF